MKQISHMSPQELAGLVCETLGKAGITVTLTGGACVGVWSSGKYVSHDLDFIEEGPVPHRQVIAAMKTLGFEPEGRLFIRHDTQIYVEFPTGPLMVGDERVNRAEILDTPAGQLRLLTPTDCVKDRLAAYFHWNDRQSLEQALLVARAQKIQMEDVRRWAKAEGSMDKFDIFQRRVKE
jgi:hemin uptake protein HemP